ncbi:MAG: glycosyltransferase family 2 protein [Chlorobi bacterium]|nr:glycosyltransferase family 2 protein [Chlorobiota bacterium]MCI0715086.1 glycosyltransferase family 2 protein [Chlorobiota bacterium]
MEEIILFIYIGSLIILFTFGSHGFIMIYYYLKHRHKRDDLSEDLDGHPMVTIQLPVYNEMYVVERLIKTTCEIDYPIDRLEIQVLDDSTDETVEIAANVVREYQMRGFDIKHIHRDDRSGFKAGALKKGLETAKGEFVAIFDADFIPRKNFLKVVLPYFKDPKIGMVQTRWEHLNRSYSLVTQIQALALDGHFVIEQQVRNKAGYFINFNGTSGIWRTECIFDAGNWEADTLTEDLDLSYRAQLKGWKFKYLTDFSTPSEVPSEINSLKSQQFRWTKGAIETAKKMLFRVWGSGVPLKTKIMCTFHLTNNIVFPFILIACLLNMPIVLIKNSGHYDTYFLFMSVFVLAFIASFLFYLYSQKDVYEDWRSRILLFPVFMAGSMGFAINNTKAVFEGLLNKKSEFVRTPKYGIEGEKDTWQDKKYVQKKIKLSVIFELLVALYSFACVIVSLVTLQISAIPFQLMFAFGFGLVAYLSIKHVVDSNKRASEQSA